MLGERGGFEPCGLAAEVGSADLVAVGTGEIDPQDLGAIGDDVAKSRPSKGDVDETAVDEPRAVQEGSFEGRTFEVLSFEHGVLEVRANEGQCGHGRSPALETAFAVRPGWTIGE